MTCDSELLGVTFNKQVHFPERTPVTLIHSWKCNTVCGNQIVWHTVPHYSHPPTKGLLILCGWSYCTGMSINMLAIKISAFNVLHIHG